MDRTYITFSDNHHYESGMKITATSSVLFWFALVTCAILQSEIGSAGMLAGDEMFRACLCVANRPHVDTFTADSSLKGKNKGAKTLFNY